MVVENVEAVNKSATAIQAIAFIATQSAEAIRENRAAVEMNTQAVAENERIVRQATSAIEKLQQLQTLMDSLEQHKTLIVASLGVIAVLVVVQPVLMCIAIRRVLRLLTALRHIQ